VGVVEETGGTLRLLTAGPCTLVVDHGRPRARSLGVPVGGAADRFALALGNALVGNPPLAAALEISLAGPTLVADCDLACVVSGAPFELASDRKILAPGKTFTLRAGEELRIGSTPAGMRGYFCVRGGLRQREILGSQSSLEPLQAGAELECAPGSIRSRFVCLENEALVATNGVCQLHVLDGPQADWFRHDGFFTEGGRCPTFTVSPASNRMGLRLIGEPLKLPERELTSEPVCPGSVQVTRDGQTIVLGVDGQTIGGYPKIAQVISADLDRLGQLRPGERVAFRRVSLAEAERLQRERQKLLHEWLTRLRTTEAVGS
jgi:antagonist of KipI